MATIPTPIDLEPDLKPLYDKYTGLQHSLREKRAMLEGKVNLGRSFSIPAQLRRSLSSRSGLASMIIDLLAARIVYQGINVPEDADLGVDITGILDDADFDSIATLLVQDALVYGAGFCLVSRDDEGPVYTAIPPTHVFSEFSAMTRRITRALVVSDDLLSVYTDSEVTYYTRHKTGVEMIGTEDLSGMPIVPVFNTSSSMQMGKSELSAGVRDAITEYSRITMRKAAAEELYSSLDATILGGDPELLVDEDGNPTSVFSALMGQTRQIPQQMVDERTGELGSVPQLSYAPQRDPEPFIKALDHKMTEIGNLVGIPSYLLIDSSTSAEKAAMQEQRLIRGSEQRISAMRRGLKGIILETIRQELGDIPDSARGITINFASPSTPTASAAADASLKWVQAGVMSPESAVLQARLGFTPEEVETIRRERAENRGTSVLERIREARNGSDNTEVTDSATIID